MIKLNSIILDSRKYDEYKINQAVYEKIINKYGKEGTFWNKILYYFAEKEIAENIRQNIASELKTKNSQNIFLDEEKSYFASFIHILENFPINSKNFDKSNIEEKTFSILDIVVNEYIYDMWEFENISDKKNFLKNKLTNFFLSDRDFKYISKEQDIEPSKIATDIFDKIEIAKENMEIVNYINNMYDIESGIVLDGQNFSNANQYEQQTKKSNKDLIYDFIQKYQDIPYILRICDIDMNDPQIEDKLKLPDNISKIKELKNSKFTINLRFCKQPKTIVFENKSRFYNNFWTRVWFFWKNMPRYLKIIISLLVFGIGSFFAWFYILWLLIFVFFRQFAKTKADLSQAMDHQVSTIINSGKQFLEKKEENIDSNSNFLSSFFRKSSYKERRIDPIPTIFRQNLLFSDILITNFQKNIFDIDLKSELEKLIMIVICRMQVRYDTWIQTIWIENQSDKFFILQKILKYLILSSNIIWLNLSSSTILEQISQNPIFQKIQIEYEHDLLFSKSKYNWFTNKKAFLDWFLSSIIAWFVSFIWHNIFSPNVAMASSPAVHKTIEIAIDDDNQIWKDLNLDPNNYITEDIDILKKNISDLDWYLVKWNEVWKKWWDLIFDEKLENIKNILSEDDFKLLFDKIKESKIENTLWETIKTINPEQVDEYTQKIVDEVWKSTDEKNLSEIFAIAKNNWIPIWDYDNKLRNRLSSILKNIYNYEWYENYNQRIEISWLQENLSKIMDKDYDISNFDIDYSLEQRSILTHSAFVWIERQDLQELFLDNTNDLKIWDIIEKTNIENNKDLTWDIILTWNQIWSWVNSFTWLWDIVSDKLDGLKSQMQNIPKPNNLIFSIGRNRILEKQEV